MQRLQRTAWVLLLAAFAAPVWADADCKQLSDRSEAAYQTGKFDEALAALDECLASEPKRGERVPVLALKAKVQLVLDDREAAKATISSLLQIDPGYGYNALRDPPLFIQMIDELRVEDTTIKVSSVSKTPESLRLAPATVMVITAEEIARRGYTDLEALFHDLSGFDISRSTGAVYSNVYQRGVRSDFTNRTLLLIDGVEENELQSGVAILSRQYPLSDVDRVEVIHGPSSTMYGANAFSGVVNVITKTPEDLIGEGELGGQVEVSGGSFDTGSLDATVAGKAAGGSLSWSLTGRIFRSEEMDLSEYEDWDYDPAVFEDPEFFGLYQANLRFAATDELSVDQYIQGLCANAENPVDCFDAVKTSSLLDVSDTGISLNDDGLRRAIALDQRAYLDDFGGAPVDYSNETDDWYVHGKLVAPNLEVGVQLWRRSEGLIGAYTDLTLPGTDNGAVWLLKQNWFYVKYNRQLSDALDLTFFSRYKEHELDGLSNFATLQTYRGGSFNVRNLVEGVPGTWSDLYLYHSATQLRNELRLVLNPPSWPRLEVVTGLELRNSSIPANDIFSTEPNPESTGQPASSGVPAGNQISSENLGLFAQASYRAWKDLKLVVGGRFDNNQVRDSTGFGTVFNPRLAVIYPFRDWVFKAVYAEAYQAPTNFQRFVTTPGSQDLPAPGLDPEKVKNLELAFNWQPAEGVAIDLVAYDSSYSNVVELAEVECTQVPPCTSATTLKNENVGSLAVRGLQAHASWKRRGYEVFGNYTYTDSVNTDPLDGNGRPLGGELRVGDVASHQVNLGFNTELRERFNLNLRANYVDSKPTGENTTVSKNPLSEIDAYFVSHLILSYDDLWPGSRLSLIVNNLFDEKYYHPGVRTADGTFFAERLPQRKRSVLLRFSTAF